MYIEPVKKTSKASRSSDKRQQQGKKKQQRQFLEKFRKTLDKYRKRKIIKNKLNTRQKKYKSKSLQEEIYRREVAKNRSYSKVYHTLNDKKEPSKSTSKIVINQKVVTNSNNKKNSHARTMSTSKPSSKVQKTQPVKTKKQTQNIKNKSTAKATQQKASKKIKTTTTTSKSKYISSKPEKPQQLMRSVQKHTTRRIDQHPTNSIEKMLGEYSQSYRKSKNLNRTDTRQNRENIHKATRPKKQIPTKKEEVQQFKKGIANTKKTTKDIAYREYEKSINKRVAMQRRMSNKGRER